MTAALATLLVLAGLVTGLLVLRPWFGAMPRPLGEADAPARGALESPGESGEELGADAQVSALRDEHRRRWRREHAQAAAAGPPPPSRRRRGVGVALALLPLLAAMAAYLASGGWRTLEALRAAQQPDPGPTEIAHIIEGLRLQLARTPDDAMRWALLAQSLEVVHHDGEAAEAFARANTLASPPNPDWLVSEGEDYARAHGHDLAGLPGERFAAALAIDPDHARALWYAGMAALQQHDAAGARRAWERLARQDLPADARAALGDALARVGGRLPVQAAALGAGVQLHVHVELAPALAGDLRPGDLLFVFARAPSGPPMPLAVRRLPAQLPADVTLDDSMAPMPGPGLGAYPAWEITARISHSGAAAPAPGDLEGHLHLARTQAAQPATVRIDAMLPATPAGALPGASAP